MSKRAKHSFIYRHSLILVFALMLVLALAGQIILGRDEYNQELVEQYHQPPVGWGAYLTSGHFLSTTFENWESEFLQMGLYVLLTVFLRQIGAPDSRPLEKNQEKKAPKITPQSPWPVRKGGIWLKLYENSLSIAFGFLFLSCFCLHLYGSWKHYNTEQLLEGKPAEALTAYFSNSKFWFESLQNWQSEFLAVASLVLLSIYLRQKNSPESKEVEAPHFQTGK